jgi:N-carbamoylputrescine amidase
MSRVIPIKDISRYVTVCATQYSMTNDIEQNLLIAESIVRLAASKGGQIILLPELFSNLYFCQEQLDSSFSLALPNDINNNYILKKFRNLSKELNICLPISFFEKSNQAHYNSCVVFDSGKYLGNNL